MAKTLPRATQDSSASTYIICRKCPAKDYYSFINYPLCKLGCQEKAKRDLFSLDKHSSVRKDSKY